MTDDDRFRLHFGPYATPPFRYGEIVHCEVRGDVQIVRLSDGKIPWPIGKRGRASTYVVYADLARAVQCESNQAVCHWWGITGQTVTKWRKAFDIHRNTAGSTILQGTWTAKVRYPKAKPAILAKARDPERCAKIAASRRGKPRPPHVHEILRKANLGRKASEETRRKMREAHRRLGTRPPAAGVAWTPEEDALIGEMPVPEIAARTGRSQAAVRCRRRQVKRLAALQEIDSPGLALERDQIPARSVECG